MIGDKFRSDLGFPPSTYAYVHCPNPQADTPVVYVALPDGACIPISFGKDELQQRRRADFIADAINRRLSPLPPQAD